MIMRSILPGIFLISLAGACGWTESSSKFAESDWERPVSQIRQASIGTGYSSITDQTKLPCMESVVTTGNLTASASDDDQSMITIRKLELIDDRAYLRDVFSRVSSAELFKKFNGSAVGKRTSDLESYPFDQYSLYLATSARIVTGNDALQSYQWTSQARTWIDNQQWDRLATVCGDRYIHSTQSGGEMIAIIKIETKGADDQRQLRETLSNLLTETDANLDDLLRDRMKTPIPHVDGASLSLELPLKLNDWRKFAQEFAKDIRLTGGNKSSVVLRSYVELDQSLAPLRVITDSYGLNDYAASLDYLAKELRVRQHLIWDLDYMLERNQEQFSAIKPGTTTELAFPYYRKIRDELRRQLNEIGRHGRSCMQTPKSCDESIQQLPELPSYSPPQRY